MLHFHDFERVHKSNPSHVSIISSLVVEIHLLPVISDEAPFQIKVNPNVVLVFFISETLFVDVSQTARKEVLALICDHFVVEGHGE